MSSYTNLIHRGLRLRHDIANRTWSSTPQDEISPYDLVLARLSLLCGNRSYFDSMGMLWSEGAPWPGTHRPRQANYGEGVVFAVPTIQFWSEGLIDEDDYLDMSEWFNRDYNLEDLRKAGLHPAIVDGLWSAYHIVRKMRPILEWIPAHVYNLWQKCITAGGIPYFQNSRQLAAAAGGGPTPWPDWLEGRLERQYAWDNICRLFEPIQKDYKALGWEIYRRDAARIAEDVRFWEAVSKWSGVDAINNIWDGFKSKIRNFNSNQQVARDSALEARRLMLAEPAAFSAEQQKELAEVQGEITNNSAGAKDSIGGQVLNILMEEGEQLGIHPAVYAVGAAVLASAAAAFATWVVASEVTKQKAIRTLNGFIKSRDDFDNAKYEYQMQAIEQKESELWQKKGQLPADEWQRLWDALQAQKEIVSSELLKAREQTKQAANELSQNLKKQTEGGLVDLFGDMKVLAIAGALGVGGLILYNQQRKGARS